MQSEAPSFLTGAERPARDLGRLREKVAEARDLALLVADLEARLADAKSALNKAQQTELPDLMDELGVQSIELPASGNLPGFSAKLTPFYSANIRAGWPEEKREAAFAKLTALGAEDLIKTELTALFGPGDMQLALLAADYARRACGAEPRVAKTVPWQTLTAWLKERAEQGALPPQSDLEVIGATAGRIVKVKELE